MKKNSSLYDDEIDLIRIMKNIWDGKLILILITVFSILIGFVYSLSLPNNFQYSLKIKPNVYSEFIQVDYLYKSLKENYKNSQTNLSINKSTNNFNEISIIFFNRFIDEILDYDELTILLKENKEIKKNISKLSLNDQNKKLFNYAKNLKVKKMKNNQNEYDLVFEWHDINDINEIENILKETLKLTLINLEKNLYKELDDLLKIENKQILYNDSKRIEYLQEQSIIARELNISDNQVDSMNLSQVVEQDLSNSGLQVNSNDPAYYLRGYKAIEKEIELIKSREYMQFNFFEDEISNLKKKDIRWIKYNTFLGKTKSLKPVKKIFAISILLGLIIGAIFVIILKEYHSLKVSKKKNN